MRAVLRHDLRRDLLHLCALLFEAVDAPREVTRDMCAFRPSHPVERVERPAHGIHEHLSRTGDVRTLADLDHAVLL